MLAYELATADDPIAGLAGYERMRRDATTAVVLANREMHVAGRGSGDLAVITDTYRHTTGSDADALEHSRNLTPP